jgi:hypothetical protein
MSELGEPGDRVRLLYSSDPITKLEPGLLGTIDCVDCVGTRHVKWDNGSTLGLVSGPGGDRWEVVEHDPVHEDHREDTSEDDDSDLHETDYP